MRRTSDWRIRTAAVTAFTASRGVDTGAPKTAMIASPMYLSTTPSESMTIPTISVKYSFKSPTSSCAFIFSLIVVKLRMSVNRMVTVSVAPPSCTLPPRTCAMTDAVMYLPIVVFRLSRSFSPSTIVLNPAASASSSSPVLSGSTCTYSCSASFRMPTFTRISARDMIDARRIPTVTETVRREEEHEEREEEVLPDNLLHVGHVERVNDANRGSRGDLQLRRLEAPERPGARADVGHLRVLADGVDSPRREAGAPREAGVSSRERQLHAELHRGVGDVVVVERHAHDRRAVARARVAESPP